MVTFLFSTLCPLPLASEHLFFAARLGEEGQGWNPLTEALTNWKRGAPVLDVWLRTINVNAVGPTGHLWGGPRPFYTGELVVFFRSGDQEVILPAPLLHSASAVHRGKWQARLDDRFRVGVRAQLDAEVSELNVEVMC